MCVFSPAAGTHYTPVSFLLTFEGDDKFQPVEVPILQDNVTEGPKNFKVLLSFINYTNGQAVSNDDVKRILLKHDAQVTIYSDSPTSETMNMDTMNIGICRIILEKWLIVQVNINAQIFFLPVAFFSNIQI